MNREPDLKNVRITAVERLTNSANGNPRFRLALDNGQMYVTKSDGACSFEVTNYANSGAPFDAWLTKAGRISVMSKPGEWEGWSKD